VTLLDLFDASVAERGAALAVNDVSYRDLDAGIARVAHGLRERGLRAGDRIALFCENRLAFVYVYLAALRLGAISVPANILYRASDLARLRRTKS
jgi:long-chain acyl-CoA synthetase